MASTDPSEPLRNGISEYYSSGLFSDLEIRASNGDSHRVHKLVVSAQCKFLADAINPLYGFKPSQTNIIELNHDPHIVRALLSYLYRFDYAVPNTAPSAPFSSSPPSPPHATQTKRASCPNTPPPVLDHSLLFHARLHAAAIFYGVPALAQLALTRFIAGASDLWRTPAQLAALVRVLYGTDTSSSSSSSKDKTNSNTVLASLPPPSSNTAIDDNDEDNNDNNTSTATFPAADDGVAALRAAVVRIAVAHFATLARSREWRDAMDGAGAFGREACEALVAAARQRKVAAGYRCGTCAEVVWMCLPPEGEAQAADGYVHCVLCGHMWLRSAWAGRRVCDG